MGDTLLMIGGVIAWVAEIIIARIVWPLVKLIVMAGVIFGALKSSHSNAPVSWPELEFTIVGIGEHVSLAFTFLADSWLPLSIAIIVFFAWGVKGELIAIRTDTVQTKIAVVAIANYLDIGVETEATKLLRENGFKGLLSMWRTNFWLYLLMGKTQDDTLSAKPMRLGEPVDFLSDVDGQIQKAMNR